MEILTVVFIGGVVLFGATLILEALWNMTMPQVFRLPPITFWVAFRLIIIGGLLSGGFFRVNF
jgi:hypothetical protein